MSLARRLSFAILGLLIGGAVGAGTGLLGGLAYTEHVNYSNFEGGSGYGLTAWLVCGLFLGAIAGTIIGARWGRT